MFKKINLYVFIQIFKSCTLVFFIFISIAWLLQISRLFSYLSNLQIKFFDILGLSIFLIPNLTNVIFPFVIIFGLIIAFIKFDKDKEIIAIYSLGLSINEIKKPLIIFSLLIAMIYILLNYFLSPIVYDIYKKKEFELRNLIDLNNVNIANFIEVDKDLVLDFVKEDQKIEDVFIYFKEDEDNLIYAKEANIENLDNEIIFKLYNGFKLSFKNQEIEKLEFENYKFKFPTKKNKFYNNIDENSLTFNKLLKDKNYIKIVMKISETITFISLILIFYLLNIKRNIYNLVNIFIFLTISLLVLIFQNFINNINLNLNQTTILILLNISFPYLYVYYKNYKAL